jgi:hypothetical protein
MRLKQRRRVLLLQPEGPIIAVMRRPGTTSETWRKAWKSLYQTPKPLRTIL